MVLPELIGVDVFVSLSAYVRLFQRDITPYLFATWDFVVVVSFVSKIALARMSCHRVAVSFVQILSIIKIERSKALTGPCRSTPGDPGSNDPCYADTYYLFCDLSSFVGGVSTFFTCMTSSRIAMDSPQLSRETFNIFEKHFLFHKEKCVALYRIKRLLCY